MPRRPVLGAEPTQPEPQQTAGGEGRAHPPCTGQNWQLGRRLFGCEYLFRDWLTPFPLCGFTWGHHREDPSCTEPPCTDARPRLGETWRGRAVGMSVLCLGPSI